MKCFIDGTCLCVVRDDFVNVQESKDIVFIDLSRGQLQMLDMLNIK